MSCHVDKEREPRLANTTEPSPQKREACFIAALSNETMDRIFEILHDERSLVPCGAVARRWEMPVRRILFRELTVTEEPEDLQHLAEIVTPELSRFVKRLYFRVFVPNCDDDVDEEGNDDVFERSITSLLRIMAAWHHDGQAPKVVLSIHNDFSSPKPDWLKRQSESGFELYHRRPNPQESGFKYSRFNLDCETLPLVACVKQLMIHLNAGRSMNTTGRRIAPATWPKLLSKMPSVTITSIAINDCFPYVGLQRNDRRGLAESIRDDGYMSTSMVRDVKLDMERWLLHKSILQHGELLSPYSFDPLSASVRNWSHNLIRLDLRGMFDQSLFWPQQNERDGYEATAEPLWPNLEKFIVELQVESPSGKYYLLPGDDHRDKIQPVPTSNPGNSPPRLSDDRTTRNEIEQGGPGEQYILVPPPQPLRRQKRSSDAREVPCPETFNPVVEAWAQALRNMPSLRSAQLLMAGYLDEGINKSFDDRNFIWRIGYQAPGVMTWAKKWEPFRRLEFYNVMGWRPEDSTMDKLRQVGEKSHSGRDMKILEGRRRHLPPIDDSTLPGEWPPSPYEWVVEVDE